MWLHEAISWRYGAGSFESSGQMSEAGEIPPIGCHLEERRRICGPAIPESIWWIPYRERGPAPRHSDPRDKRGFASIKVGVFVQMPVWSAHRSASCG